MRFAALAVLEVSRQLDFLEETCSAAIQLGFFGLGLGGCFVRCCFGPLLCPLCFCPLFQCAERFGPLSLSLGFGCRSLCQCAGRSLSLGLSVRLGRLSLSGLVLCGSLDFAPTFCTLGRCSLCGFGFYLFGGLVLRGLLGFASSFCTLCRCALCGVGF